MTLTESSIDASSVSLADTSYFLAMTVSAGIGQYLSVEFFAFVVGVATQAIEEGDLSPVTEIEIMAPNSILQRAFQRTIGLI